MEIITKLAKADKRNLVTKIDGTLKSRVIEAVNVCVFNRIIYPVFYTGKGNYVNKVTYFNELTTVLNLLNLKYEIGNDAPRGGANGEFIKISQIALSKLKSLV